MKCYKDSTKWLMRDCKFWPDVREVGEGNALTRLVMVSPKKVECFLRKKLSKKYAWSVNEVCLVEHLW